MLFQLVALLSQGQHHLQIKDCPNRSHVSAHKPSWLNQRLCMFELNLDDWCRGGEVVSYCVCYTNTVRLGLHYGLLDLGQCSGAIESQPCNVKVRFSARGQQLANPDDWCRGGEVVTTSLALPDPRRQPVIAYSMNARITGWRRGSGNARLVTTPIYYTNTVCLRSRIGP